MSHNRFRFRLSYLLLLCSMFLFSFSAVAKEADSTKALVHQQKIETLNQKISNIKAKNKLSKQRLETLNKDQEALKPILTPDRVDDAMFERAILELALSAANYDGAQISQAEAEQMVDATQLRIKNLENDMQNMASFGGKTATVKQRLQSLQAELNADRALLKMEQKYRDETTRSLSFSNDTLNLQKEWKDRLGSLYKIKQQQARQEDLVEQESVIQKEQQVWLDKLSALTAQVEALDLQGEGASQQRQKLLLSIFEAQESSNFSHLSLLLLRFNNQVVLLQERLSHSTTIQSLNADNNRVNVLLKELINMKDLANKKNDLIDSRKEVLTESLDKEIISKAEYKSAIKALNRLLANYEQTYVELNVLYQQAKTVQGIIQKQLNRVLSRRQGLPGFNLKEWVSLGQQLLTIPSLLVPVIKSIQDQFVMSFSKLKFSRVCGIFLAELALFALWSWVRKRVNIFVAKISIERESISDNMIYTIFELWRRNMTGLFLFFGLTVLCVLSKVPVKSFMPIVSMLVVWFVFKIAIGLLRLVLLETSTNVSGRDVLLYERLKWVLLTGGAVTMFTVLVHHLPVDYVVRDFFNRLFMLFLLVISILFLHEWKVVPTLLAPYIDGTRPYLMRTVRLLSFLIPLTIFSTAIIGLLGYVDLAWSMSKHEGLFLLVLTGFILARGFLSEFMDWLSELFIRRLRNGWLWTQAILRPLDKILRIVLLLLVFFALFVLYGWGPQSYMYQFIVNLLNFHLVSFETGTITLLGIINFVIAVAILVWIGKWTREFAYRWLFAKTRDLGLRHSLAAFTQYAAVIFGLVVALRLMGVDLTGLNWILTALAVGVGFGLRDLAKNYVSGFLLLMERPVRAGDLVSIGNFEGVVTHIGMRAMTVKTWDHMEVLVPNSEAFEKPFTNWTHQDSIVRTVIALKINRADDPVRIKGLVLDVLESIDDVVTDPPSQVFMKEIDDALVELQVRYFINLQLGTARAAVRSMVLFSLWQCFEEHGIKPPYPQQEIHIQTLPELSSKK